LDRQTDRQLAKLEVVLTKFIYFVFININIIVVVVVVVADKWLLLV